MAITRFLRVPFGSAIPCFEQQQAYVYLLHFSQKYRWAQHRAGNGARLVEVIKQVGIDFEVARIWRFDSCEEARRWEHTLKARQHNGRECPICTGKPFDGYVSLRQGHWPFHLFPQGQRRPMRVTR